MALDDLKTVKMDVEPALIVDAKALYDLLSKPEVQANSGTDKRTTIEALVAQDKLSCCGAKTRWVSSDHQYADGLAKQAAAQLLAERLRTHLVKLKSDTTFQAAKKKSPQERKKNTEMYALKKPQRALQAMFAMSMCWTTSSATYLDNTNHTTFTYTDLYPGMLKMLYTMILAIAIGIMMLGGWKMWKSSKRVLEDSTPAVSSVGTQTELEMHEVVSFQEYFNSMRCTDWSTSPRRRWFRSMCAMPCKRPTIANRIYNYYEALDQRLRAQEQQHRANLHNLTQAPVFFTKNSRCWHADPECLRSYAPDVRVRWVASLFLTWDLLLLDRAAEP